MTLLSDRLLELRKQKKLSREEASELLHVDRETLARYERGNRVPQAEFIGEAARVYGVSADFLLGLSTSEDTKKAPAETKPGEGENYGIQLNNSANSGTITQTVTPSPHAVQSSDDLEAALRLRRDRPEVVKMLPDPDYSDDMIRAVYERMLKSAKQG